jgi:alpha-galactosidase
VKREPTIVIMGAASAYFGPILIRDIINHPGLGGSTVRLVDVDEPRLKVIDRLARRVNDGLEHPVVLESTADRKEALKGADFVCISVDIEHSDTWRQDVEIPVSMGVRQSRGETTEVGGIFHALRQIPLHLEIARDIRALCPNAMVLVESNPLTRICLALHRYGNIGTIVGLCHAVDIARSWIAGLLHLKVDDVLATAAGVNHFGWILDLRHNVTGEDLYPAFRQKCKEVDSMDMSLKWPLSRKLMDVFGCFPTCGDDHVAEFVRYGWEFEGGKGPDLDQRAVKLGSMWQFVEKAASGKGPLRKPRGRSRAGDDADVAEFFFRPHTVWDTDSFPLMNAVHTNAFHRMPAVNMLNRGTITNLPQEAFVETPAAVDASGVHRLPIGELPAGLAALCRRDIDEADIVVEAAVKGDRKLVMQAMLMSHAIDSVRTAERVADVMFRAYARYLPQFA